MAKLVKPVKFLHKKSKISSFKIYSYISKKYQANNISKITIDCILCIALHTDFYTTLRLLETCKFDLTYDNFWKLKCKTQFPDKYYVEKWLGIENYLVYLRKQFALIIHFHHHNCLPYVYEYDKVFKHLIRLNEEMICTHDLIKLEIKGNFVLISKTMDYKFNITYFETDLQAIEAYKTLPLFEDDSEDGEEYPIEYVIVNLTNCVPWFLKFGKKRKQICPKCEKSKPIPTPIACFLPQFSSEESDGLEDSDYDESYESEYNKDGNNSNEIEEDSEDNKIEENDENEK